MKALVIGVPGVGKTAVLKKAKEKLPDHKVLNFGTQMLETAKKQGIIEHRDQIRKLQPKKMKELQKKAAEKIAKKKNILIDTHLTQQTPKGILPGMPKWILNELSIDKVILIEAKPENINKRRKKDETRERSDFKLPPEEHQKLNRYYAATASTLTGALIKIIKNKEGKINKAAEQLANTMEEK